MTDFNQLVGSRTGPVFASSTNSSAAGPDRAIDKATPRTPASAAAMITVMKIPVNAQPTGCAATERAKAKHISDTSTISGIEPTNGLLSRQ